MAIMTRSRLLTIFAIGLAYIIGKRSSGAKPLQPFEELSSTGLYRHNYDFPFMPPPALACPVSTFLVKIDEKNWVLVDTGAPGRYQTSLQYALKKMLGSPDDKLRLVILTHGHGDHIDGLQWLLDNYPESKLVMHEDEQQFRSGKASYSDLHGDGWKYEYGGKYLISAAAPGKIEVDPSREILLRGESGDLHSYASFVPRGLLEFLHTPGHSPGHCAFIHKPSKSVIAGDTFSSMPWLFPFVKSDVATVDPLYIATNSLADMKVSQKKLAALKGVETFYPGHDAATGVSLSSLTKLAMTK